MENTVIFTNVTSGANGDAKLSSEKGEGGGERERDPEPPLDPLLLITRSTGKS